MLDFSLFFLNNSYIAIKLHDLDSKFKKNVDNLYQFDLEETVYE